MLILSRFAEAEEFRTFAASRPNLRLCAFLGGKRRSRQHGSFPRNLFGFHILPAVRTEGGRPEERRRSHPDAVSGMQGRSVQQISQIEARNAHPRHCAEIKSKLHKSSDDAHRGRTETAFRINPRLSRVRSVFVKRL